MTAAITDVLSVAFGTWYHLPLGVLIVGLTFGFAPGLLLNLGVLLYPKGHPRRTELVAELHEIPYFKRAFWVFYALQLSVTEGLPGRARNIRRIQLDRRWRRFDTVMSEMNKTVAKYRDVEGTYIEAYPKMRKRYCFLVVQNGRVRGRFVLPGIRHVSDESMSRLAFHSFILRKKWERSMLRRTLRKMREVN